MPAYPRPLLNMMEHAYMIRNWPDHFETYESGKIKGPLQWVAMPTKHDGRGYLRVARHKNGVPALCGWWSMLGVAAKMPIRGLLADRDGPLDADDISIKTNLPAKIYLITFDLMSAEKIWWLEKVPWDTKLDFAGNIAALIRLQHLPADALDFQRATAGNSRRQRKIKERTVAGRPLAEQQAPADNSAAAEIPADSSGPQRNAAGVLIQDSTRQTGQSPLPSPKGDSQPGNLIRNRETAKRLICEKILGGKNPGRMWSPEAENELARKCQEEGGIPLQEIMDIAEYRAIPRSDDIPDLKKRRDPITETTLMLYWGDEVTRAQDYLRVYRRNGAEKKPEPKLWREFFRWKYDENCELPASFALLDDDQKKEWERDHAEFEESAAGRAMEVLSA